MEALAATCVDGHRLRVASGLCAVLSTVIELLA
jgi:hypothetical protein